jgi:hypothetical protein
MKNIVKKFHQKRYMKLFEKSLALEQPYLPPLDECNCPLCTVIRDRKEVIYPPRVKKKMARIAKKMARLYPLLV